MLRAGQGLACEGADGGGIWRADAAELIPPLASVRPGLGGVRVGRELGPVAHRWRVPPWGVACGCGHVSVSPTWAARPLALGHISWLWVCPSVAVVWTRPSGPPAVKAAGCGTAEGCACRCGERGRLRRRRWRVTGALSAVAPAARGRRDPAAAPAPGGGAGSQDAAQRPTAACHVRGAPPSQPRLKHRWLKTLLLHGAP